MSEAEFKLPRKFTFDEYYELLKKLVSDPEAQKQFAVYDAECKAGRGDILDSENGGVAAVALFNFRSIGNEMLYSRGWPIYAKGLEIERKTGVLVNYSVQSFSDTGLSIMQGKSPWPEHDLLLDIADRNSIRRYLEIKMSIPNIAPYQIYDLEEGN